MCDSIQNVISCVMYCSYGSLYIYTLLGVYGRDQMCILLGILE